ncbi:MAG: glycosyltransferase family 2 protein [Chthoniobacterales bacterium]
MEDSLDSATLIVVLPIYNEESNIAAVISEWTDCFNRLGIPFQIIAINDGSRDGTQEILRQLESEKSTELRVVKKANSGHGKTCRVGYDVAVNSDAEWIFQIDSDGQCDPQFFAQFWTQRESYDCLFGQRVSRDDGGLRTFVSVACRETLRFFSGVSIADPNVPYRLMRRETLAKALRQIPADFELQNIALALALKRDPAVRFTFIPIHFRARRAGRNSLNFWRIICLGWKMVRDLKKIR